MEVQRRRKGHDTSALLIWHSAMAKPSASHVRQLELGFKLFFAVSRIYGSARLIMAQLGQRAIFSCATATLVAMQFHKWYSSPTIPYIDMNHISSFTTFETLQNQAGRICLMILTHQLEHRVRDKGRNACAMPAFQSGQSYNFDRLELMEAGSKAELTY